VTHFTLEPYWERISSAQPIAIHGKVVDVVGLTIEATGPPMHIGDLCYIHPPRGGEAIPVEVVGFRGSRILLMPLGEMTGVAPNSLVSPTFKAQTVRVGLDLLGRVIGSMGRPLDGRPLD
jgi:flagellum-specific ATP synthase